MNRNRQICFSVIASVAMHMLFVIVAVFLIGLSGLFPPEQAEASIPSEVVIYLPEMLPVQKVAQEKGKPFLRTNEKSAVDEAPMDAAFESDRNTVAATEAPPPLAPDAAKPLPTQEGAKNIPFMELDDREYVDGEEPSEDASKPSPPAVVAMAAPTPLMPKPESAVAAGEDNDEQLLRPKSAATDMKENSFSDRLDPIAMRLPQELKTTGDGELPEENPEPLADRSTEPAKMIAERQPAVPEASVPPSKPAPDKEAFRPHTRSTEMTGTISNRGVSSVSAAATPLGKYKAIVSRAIEKKWHRYREDKAEFLVYGSIKLRFKVDRNGRPRNLKIIKNDANAIMADFTLSAILEADIPPMPVEILDILENEELEVTYDVIIY